MSSSGVSKACCTIPPAVVDNYKAKGKYITIENGMQCYVTGPETASSAIFMIYDIFGYSDQALQGADILGANTKTPTRVFVPDLLRGEPIPRSQFPPDTDEKKKKIGEFFSGRGSPAKNAELVPQIVKDIGKTVEGESVRKWGGLGFCWGGKIITLSSKSSTPFGAAAQCHPAMTDPADAKQIDIPFCVLGSKDEDAAALHAFDEALKKAHVLEIYADQVHGWMGARADLKDPKAKKEYERGYSQLVDFFDEHL